MSELSNDHGPEEVARQLTSWSRNREPSDVRQLRELMFPNNYESDASGLNEHRTISWNDQLPHQFPQGNPQVSAQGNLEVTVPSHQVPHLGGSQVHVHHQQSNQVVPSQYNQLPPHHGSQVPPQGNQVQPVPPQNNQIPPQGNQVPPQGNQVLPQGNQVLPQGNQVPPQGQAPPQYNQLPQYNQIPPQGQVPPQYNQVPPAQGQEVPPQPNKDVPVQHTQYNCLMKICIECSNWFQHTRVNICLCLGAIFIALFIGILLGALGTHGIWAINHSWREFWTNITNPERYRPNPTVSSDTQPEPTPFIDGISKWIDGHEHCEAKDTQAVCICNGDDNKDNIEELTTCKNDIKLLEAYLQTYRSAYFGFKTNFATYISGLGDVIEEYNINNNGKGWSQWCIQEWMKQGADTSPLSKPTASMDINEHFDKLANISSELNALMEEMPDK